MFVGQGVEELCDLGEAQYPVDVGVGVGVRVGYAELPTRGAQPLGGPDERADARAVDERGLDAVDDYERCWPSRAFEQSRAQLRAGRDVQFSAGLDQCEVASHAVLHGHVEVHGSPKPVLSVPAPQRRGDS